MQSIDDLRSATKAILCFDCGKCSSTCPLAESGTFSARLVAQQDEKGLAEDGGSLAQRCLTCGSCERRCPEGVKFIEFVLGLRRWIPEENRHPMPHDGIFHAAARSMAQADWEPQRGTDWIGEDLKISAEGEVGLFVGCLPFFDAYFKNSVDVQPLEIARSAIRLLNRAGIEPVVLPNERCCGHDQYWSGDHETIEKLAEANTAAFEARGVKHLVTTCAECCSTWRNDYPDIVPGYQPKVEHLSEFLAAQVEAGKIRFRQNGEDTLTFQDPCRLGRHLGVVDEPRQVLASLPGKKVVEMKHSGRDAMCCGTSGFTHCDADSKRIQKQRLAEAAETGADKLVTACPKCLIHLSCASSEERRRGNQELSIEIQDFTVLAASLLEGNGEAKEEALALAGQESGEAR